MPISGVRAAGDAIPGNIALVEFDIGGTATFADVSTWGGVSTIDDITSDTTDYKTFSGDPVTFGSAANPTNWTVECLYTEGATDPFANVLAVVMSTAFDMQVTPLGASATTGDIILTSVDGILIAKGFPTFDANSATATVFNTGIRCGTIVQSAVT